MLNNMSVTTLSKMLDGVTATTTSEAFAVNERQNKSIQIICSGHASGNGAFTVEISNDCTNWTAYNRLTSNVTNTNVQGDTRVATKTLNANGSDFLFFPHGDSFAYIRITCTVTTDGAYTAILSAY